MSGAQFVQQASNKSEHDFVKFRDTTLYGKFTTT